MNRISSHSFKSNDFQKKVFIRWVNYQLGKEEVEKISDFQSGKVLLMLIEKLAQEKHLKLANVPKAETKDHRINRMINAGKVLKVMQEDWRIPLENIGAEDIVDGHEKMILTLLWKLILKWISGRDEELPLTGSGSIGSGSNMDLSSLNNLTVPGASNTKYRRKNSVMDKSVSVREELLGWVQELISKKLNIQYTFKDFFWYSGIEFFMLLSALRPQSVSLDKVKKILSMVNEADEQQKKEWIKEAFEIANKDLGIPKLLDVEDLTLPDEQPVMIYTSLFYVFEKNNLDYVQMLTQLSPLVEQLGKYLKETLQKFSKYSTTVDYNAEVTMAASLMSEAEVNAPMKKDDLITTADYIKEVEQIKKNVQYKLNACLEHYQYLAQTDASVQPTLTSLTYLKKQVITIFSEEPKVRVFIQKKNKFKEVAHQYRLKMRQLTFSMKNLRLKLESVKKDALLFTDCEQEYKKLEISVESFESAVEEVDDLESIAKGYKKALKQNLIEIQKRLNDLRKEFLQQTKLNVAEIFENEAENLIENLKKISLKVHDLAMPDNLKPNQHRSQEIQQCANQLVGIKCELNSMELQIKKLREQCLRMIGSKKDSYSPQQLMKQIDQEYSQVLKLFQEKNIQMEKVKTIYKYLNTYQRLWDSLEITLDEVRVIPSDISVEKETEKIQEIEKETESYKAAFQRLEADYEGMLKEFPEYMEYIETLQGGLERIQTSLENKQNETKEYRLISTTLESIDPAKKLFLQWKEQNQILNKEMGEQGPCDKEILNLYNDEMRSIRDSEPELEDKINDALDKIKQLLTNDSLKLSNDSVDLLNQLTENFLQFEKEKGEWQKFQNDKFQYLLDLESIYSRVKQLSQEFLTDYDKFGKLDIRDGSELDSINQNFEQIHLQLIEWSEQHHEIIGKYDVLTKLKTELLKQIEKSKPEIQEKLFKASEQKKFENLTNRIHKLEQEYETQTRRIHATSFEKTDRLDLLRSSHDRCTRTFDEIFDQYENLENQCTKIKSEEAEFIGTKIQLSQRLEKFFGSLAQGKQILHDHQQDTEKQFLFQDLFLLGQDLMKSTLLPFRKDFENQKDHVDEQLIFEKLNFDESAQSVKKLEEQFSQKSRDWKILSDQIELALKKHEEQLFTKRHSRRSSFSQKNQLIANNLSTDDSFGRLKQFESDFKMFIDTLKADISSFLESYNIFEKKYSLFSEINQNIGQLETLNDQVMKMNVSDTSVTQKFLELESYLKQLQLDQYQNQLLVLKKEKCQPLKHSSEAFDMILKSIDSLKVKSSDVKKNLDFKKEEIDVYVQKTSVNGQLKNLSQNVQTILIQIERFDCQECASQQLKPLNDLNAYKLQLDTLREKEKNLLSENPSEFQDLAKEIEKFINEAFESIESKSKESKDLLIIIQFEGLKEEIHNLISQTQKLPREWHDSDLNGEQAKIELNSDWQLVQQLQERHSNIDGLYQKFFSEQPLEKFYGNNFKERFIKSQKDEEPEFRKWQSMKQRVDHLAQKMKDLFSLSDLQLVGKKLLETKQSITLDLELLLSMNSNGEMSLLNLNHTLFNEFQLKGEQIMKQIHDWKLNVQQQKSLQSLTQDLTEEQEKYQSFLSKGRDILKTAEILNQKHTLISKLKYDLKSLDIYDLLTSRHEDFPKRMERFMDKFKTLKDQLSQLETNMKDFYSQQFFEMNSNLKEAKNVFQKEVLLVQNILEIFDLGQEMRIFSYETTEALISKIQNLDEFKNLPLSLRLQEFQKRKSNISLKDSIFEKLLQEEFKRLEIISSAQQFVLSTVCPRFEDLYKLIQDESQKLEQIVTECLVVADFEGYQQQLEVTLKEYKQKYEQYCQLIDDEKNDVIPNIKLLKLFKEKLNQPLLMLEQSLNATKEIKQAAEMAESLLQSTKSQLRLLLETVQQSLDLQVIQQQLERAHEISQQFSRKRNQWAFENMSTKNPNPIILKSKLLKSFHENHFKKIDQESKFFADSLEKSVVSYHRFRSEISKFTQQIDLFSKQISEFNNNEQHQQSLSDSSEQNEDETEKRKQQFNQKVEQVINDFNQKISAFQSFSSKWKHENQPRIKQSLLLQTLIQESDQIISKAETVFQSSLKLADSKNRYFECEAILSRLEREISLMLNTFTSMNASVNVSSSIQNLNFTFTIGEPASGTEHTAVQNGFTKQIMQMKKELESESKKISDSEEQMLQIDTLQTSLNQNHEQEFKQNSPLNERLQVCFKNTQDLKDLLKNKKMEIQQQHFLINYVLEVDTFRQEISKLVLQYKQSELGDLNGLIGLRKSKTSMVMESLSQKYTDMDHVSKKMRDEYERLYQLARDIILKSNQTQNQLVKVENKKTVFNPKDVLQNVYQTMGMLNAVINRQFGELCIVNVRVMMKYWDAQLNSLNYYLEDCQTNVQQIQERVKNVVNDVAIMEVKEEMKRLKHEFGACADFDMFQEFSNFIGEKLSQSLSKSHLLTLDDLLPHEEVKMSLLKMNFGSMSTLTGLEPLSDVDLQNIQQQVNVLQKEWDKVGSMINEAMAEVEQVLDMNRFKEKFIEIEKRLKDIRKVLNGMVFQRQAFPVDADEEPYTRELLNNQYEELQQVIKNYENIKQDFNELTGGFIKTITMNPNLNTMYESLQKYMLKLEEAFKKRIDLYPIRMKIFTFQDKSLSLFSEISKLPFIPFKTYREELKEYQLKYETLYKEYEELSELCFVLSSEMKFLMIHVDLILERKKYGEILTKHGIKLDKLPIEEFFIRSVGNK